MCRVAIIVNCSGNTAFVDINVGNVKSLVEKNDFIFAGVPILHIISQPFPSVWHKMGDNASAIHPPTVEKLNMIFRAFVADYLNLTP